MTHIGLNAHLLSATAGYRSAGIHGYIYHLLRHLPQAAPEGWRFTAMVGAGGAVHQFDGLAVQPAAFDTDSPLRRILWEQALQPFHLGAYDLYHALAFVSPVLLPPGLPSVVTVYDLSFVHYPQVLTPARRLYLRLFTALSCRRARRVIAISYSTARDVAATFGIAPGKIDVAACAYDTGRFKPLPPAEVAEFKRREGLPERFWLFLGTLEPRKNLVTLIDAYAALPPAERLPLVLAGGKGWLYEPLYERIHSQNLTDQVFLPGFLPAEALPLWYNSAEVFLYPSVFEGFGLPVLEAMACGTPVIVSDASSLPEVAGQAGLCLPPTQVEAWTEALRRAFYDAHWREQNRQQGFIEARRYDWRYTASQTLKSYDLALRGGVE